MFQNGKETKVAKYEDVYAFYAAKDTTYFYEKYSYGFNVNRYDFTTGTVEKNVVFDKVISEDVKADVVSKINSKYKENYSAQSGNLICEWPNEMGTIYDYDGNAYKLLSYYTNGGIDIFSPMNGRFNVVYNKDNTYVSKGNSTYPSFDNDGSLVAYELGKSIIKMKDNKIVSEGKLNLKNYEYEYFLYSNGNNAYSIDYKNNYLNKYVLKNGQYTFDATIHENINSNVVTQDSKGNVWFMSKEDGRNFVFKIENGQAVKKYEVASIMNCLYVYDDNNVVVTSVYGSTIINAGSTYNPGTVETNPVVKNENNTTNVTVPELTQGVTNTINVSNEEKEVVVNLNDIAAIKSGEGSALINLSNGTKIDIPFSLIDSTLLEGATNVQVKYNTIENSDLIKGLKSVNKVFDFNLEVQYADNSVKSIHKFANGQAEVTLALTDDDLKGLDKNKIKVLYYNEETKKYEVLETKVVGNNVTFKTTHFSKFIVAEVDNAGEPVKAQIATAIGVKTGDTNNSRNVLFIGAVALISLGAIGFMGYSRVKKNK